MAKILNRVLSVLTLSRRDRDEVGGDYIRCPVKRDSDRYVGITSMEKRWVYPSMLL